MIHGLFMGGRMSDLEAKIKITVENGTAAGFNQAANSAESASKAIENAIGNVKARLKTHFDDMKKSMEQAFHVNPSTFKTLGDAQEGMFNKISSSARKVYEETRTPMEQFKAKLAEVNQLLNLGAIDVETYERKVEQLNSELEQTDGKASAAPAGWAKLDRFWLDLPHCRLPSPCLILPMPCSQSTHKSDRLYRLKASIWQYNASYWMWPTTHAPHWNQRRICTFPQAAP